MSCWIGQGRAAAEAEVDARTGAPHEAEAEDQAEARAAADADADAGAEAEAEADSKDQFLIRLASNTSCIFRSDCLLRKPRNIMTLRFCLGLAVSLVAVHLLRRQTTGFVDDAFDFRFCSG